MTSIQAELNAIDSAQRPSDEVNVAGLPVRLPKTYKPTRDIVYASGINQEGFIRGKDRLHDFEHDNGLRDKPRKPRTKRIECYNCHKKGHIARECWFERSEECTFLESDW